MAEEVFFYDEKNDTISSLTKYHAENCSIESLVEAHPDVIYFYVNLTPWVDVALDYNTYVFSTGLGMIGHTYSPLCPAGCEGQLEGCHYKKEN